MAVVNYEKMTLKELQDHELRLKKAISTVRDRSKSEARTKLEAVAKEFGFGSLGEVLGNRGGRGGKVAPKYRNPENPSETWTGRGRQPRWLAAKMKRGSKLADFAI